MIDKRIDFQPKSQIYTLTHAFAHMLARQIRQDAHSELRRPVRFYYHLHVKLLSLLRKTVSKQTSRTYVTNVLHRRTSSIHTSRAIFS